MRKKNGQFGEGNKGKPIGAKNHTTIQIKQAYHDLIAGNISKLHDDLSKLEPKDRLNVVINMSKYILPTMRATDLNVAGSEITPIVINFQD